LRPEPRHIDVERGSVVSEIRTQLERAVREHLISDVPVACFLSGGIDSSIIAALAAKELGKRLQTLRWAFTKSPRMNLPTPKQSPVDAVQPTI